MQMRESWPVSCDDPDLSPGISIRCLFPSSQDCRCRHPRTQSHRHLDQLSMKALDSAGLGLRPIHNHREDFSVWARFATRPSSEPLSTLVIYAMGCTGLPIWRVTHWGVERRTARTKAWCPPSWCPVIRIPDPDIKEELPFRDPSW